MYYNNGTTIVKDVLCRYDLSEHRLTQGTFHSEDKQIVSFS